MVLFPTTYNSCYIFIIKYKMEQKMPPRTTITQEKILKAAFKLVRKDGWHSLSARNLAEKIGCSTQPIYSAFQNMNELEDQLIKIIQTFVTNEYFLSRKSEKKFFDIGIGYIKLAQQDREFYHLLYLSGLVPLSFEDEIYPISKDLLIQRIKEDPNLAKLKDYQLERLLKNLWLFTHGMTSIIYSFPNAFSEDYIYQTLHNMGGIAVSWEFMEGYKHPKGLNLKKDFF